MFENMKVKRVEWWLWPVRFARIKRRLSKQRDVREARNNQSALLTQNNELETNETGRINYDDIWHGAGAFARRSECQRSSRVVSSALSLAVDTRYHVVVHGRSICLMSISRERKKLRKVYRSSSARHRWHWRMSPSSKLNLSRSIARPDYSIIKSR